MGALPTTALVTALAATMTKRDLKELGRYVRWIADEIGLRDWTINLCADGTETEDEAERALAEIDCCSGRRQARIDFCDDFRDIKPEDQRMAVVHELVHCHLAAVQEQCEHDLVDLIGRPADAVFTRSFRRNLEYAVDGITSALAPHMPLIEWPD